MRHPGASSICAIARGLSALLARAQRLGAAGDRLGEPQQGRARPRRRLHGPHRRPGPAPTLGGLFTPRRGAAIKGGMRRGAEPAPQAPRVDHGDRGEGRPAVGRGQGPHQGGPRRLGVGNDPRNPTMRLECSAPLSRKRLARSVQAPENGADISKRIVAGRGNLQRREPMQIAAHARVAASALTRAPARARRRRGWAGS